MKNLFLFQIFLISFGFLFTAKGKNNKEREEKAQQIFYQNQLGSVDGDFSEQLSVVNIRFKDKLELKKINLENHGEFIQFKVPDTIALEPGKFTSFDGPYFKKLSVYQIDEKSIVIRIFIDKSLNSKIENIESDVLGRRIVLSIDHKFLNLIEEEKKNIATVVSTENSRNSRKTEVMTAEGNHEVEKDVVNTQGKDATNIEKNTVVKKVIEEEIQPIRATIGSRIDDLLKQIALGSVFIILGILFYLTLQRWKRGKGSLELGAGMVDMKMLNHLVLAPKQKLSLIKVGNEQLLLSISPDRVSLITKIDYLKKDRVVEQSEKLSMFEKELLRPQRRSAQVINSKPPLIKGSLQERPTNLKNQQNILKQKTMNEPDRSQNHAKPKEGMQKGHKSINLSVTDQGIKTNKVQKSLEKVPESTENAIADVTRLIREKLKSLPRS